MRRRLTRREIRVALLALAGCLVLAGAAPARGELRVGAAVSLREPLRRIAQAFSEDPAAGALELAFGATNVLAAQLRAGARLDLLLCADERIALALAADGIAERPVAFASNRILVIASRDLALPIRAPGDLAQPGIRRIAVPEHAVPVGRYARAWLRDHALDGLLAGRLVRTEHARATLTVVDQGHADLAIVYASDARLARTARVALEIPDGQQPRIAYAAAVVTGSPHAGQARAFVRFLLGDGAQIALAEAGFGPPPRASAR
jgi:molybdate transport system substrate-binding protein